MYTMIDVAFSLYSNGNDQANFAFGRKKGMSRRQRSLRDAAIMGSVVGGTIFPGGKGVRGRLTGAVLGASAGVSGRAIGHEVFGVKRYKKRRGLRDRLN